MVFNQNIKRKIVIITLVSIMVCAIALSIGMGDIELSFAEILSTLMGKGTSMQNLVVFELRLPRIIVSVLVGVGMAIAGVQVLVFLY